MSHRAQPEESAPTLPPNLPGPEGAAPDGAPPNAWHRSTRFAVIGATLLWLAMMLGFLINTPMLNGPDEPFQFDRVVAAAHGDLVQDAGNLRRSLGVRYAEATYVPTKGRRIPSLADFQPLLRDDRPSLADLGGNSRPPSQVLNYLTQHPPLYYDAMGAVMWLLPDADGMAVDKLVLFLRAANVLLMLPLPLIFFAAARSIFGDGYISLAAPFLPILVPGMARIAATINNDNLAIPLGALIVWQCIRVMRGPTGSRTALLLAGLAVAAALTKGTMLVLLPLIPIAYLIKVVQSRSWPSWRVIAILIGGAGLASVWWVRNILVHHEIVPATAAWGPRRVRILGGLRAADDPPDVGLFVDKMVTNVPLRFWGSLGLHEPPRLPAWTIWSLTALLVAAFVVAVVTQRGHRTVIVVPWVAGFTMIATMVYKAWSTYSTHHAIAGIQGRYMYPAALGLLLPVAIATCVVLRRRARSAPLVLAAAGTVLTGWSLALSVEHYWLHRGDTLEVGTLPRALRTLAGYFPFSWPVLAFLGVIALALFATAWVLVIRSFLSTPAVASAVVAGREQPAVDGSGADPTPAPAPVSGDAPAGHAADPQGP